jgi:hypothetical protein
MEVDTNAIRLHPLRARHGLLFVSRLKHQGRGAEDRE